LSAVALIVAAGRGRRFGDPVPKQYLPLAGKAVLRHAVEAFLGHPGIAAVRVVIGPDDAVLYAGAVAGLDLLPPVTGGEERQESVRLGLESLQALQPDKVLIHDGARPLVDAATIERTLAALDGNAAVVAAIPVADTVKRVAEGRIVETLDRVGLWRAQTPQGFRFDAILAAHRDAAGMRLTDDAAVAERAGLAVALVRGHEDNVKITEPQDLARAARLLGLPDVRVGNGFDVHRFGPGDAVTLCGVRVPHDAGLVGHSDADVGLHALTDALLGAIGAGDIGQHFPPTDPRWKGADSATFLIAARDLVRQRGGLIRHVDVTLVCERPKVAPHRAAMTERIAALLEIAADRISVKATTTEGLGFTGRREGIAAQATATVVF
jgi:2-C-methyl-D-erythritol 4-phosphate cytidylyltransferase/2-C-methyl-D-erythritol 2,4-cyclodiphosphate synthase